MIQEIRNIQNVHTLEYPRLERQGSQYWKENCISQYGAVAVAVSVWFRLTAPLMFSGLRFLLEHCTWRSSPCLRDKPISTSLQTADSYGNASLA
jgi:hypothetical protein